MKYLFIDVETTGTDPRRHALIQLAGIVEIDGEEVTTVNLRIKPFPDDVINEKALEVNGISKDLMDTFKEPKVAYNEFMSILNTYVDKYNRADKFQFIGYNSRFDYDFLRQFFVKCGDKYFGSYFFWPAIDVSNIAAVEVMADRGKMRDFKLMTVAKHFGLDIDQSKAHNALYDIEITRKLFYKLVSRR